MTQPKQKDPPPEEESEAANEPRKGPGRRPMTDEERATLAPRAKLIGAEIKRRMDKAFTGTKEIATSAGVDEGTIRNYTMGSILNLRPSTVQKIAHALGCLPQELDFERHTPDSIDRDLLLLARNPQERVDALGHLARVNSERADDPEHPHYDADRVQERRDRARMFTDQLGEADETPPAPSNGHRPAGLQPRAAAPAADGPLEMPAGIMHVTLPNGMVVDGTPEQIAALANSLGLGAAPQPAAPLDLLRQALAAAQAPQPPATPSLEQLLAQLTGAHPQQAPGQLTPSAIAQLLQQVTPQAQPPQAAPQQPSAAAPSTDAQPAEAAAPVDTKAAREAIFAKDEARAGEVVDAWLGSKKAPPTETKELLALTQTDCDKLANSILRVLQQAGFGDGDSGEISPEHFELAAAHYVARIEDEPAREHLENGLTTALSSMLAPATEPEPAAT